MPPFWNIKELVNQAHTSGARSTIMQPLMWLIGILSAAVVSGAHYEIPVWILTTLGILLVLSIISFLIVYLTFVFTNPDLIRTERFTFLKMAMEKNLIGDSTVGFVEVEEFTDVKAISAPEPKSLEEHT